MLGINIGLTQFALSSDSLMKSIRCKNSHNFVDERALPLPQRIFLLNPPAVLEERGVIVILECVSLLTK